MNQDDFRLALREGHSWPCVYNYKFVVKVQQEADLLSLLTGKAISKRYSSGNKYVSVTATAMANDPDEVIAVYRNASTIEGVIPL